MHLIQIFDLKEIQLNQGTEAGKSNLYFKTTVMEGEEEKNSRLFLLLFHAPETA